MTISETRLTLLVLRAQSGDRSAMDQLLAAYQSEVFSYLERMLGNHSDAEDALQMTLLQAIKKLRWLREPSSFRPWVYRIASRYAYRVIASRQRDREHSNADQLEAVEDTIDQNELAELIEQIPQWLEKLTAKGREVMILHYLEGFTAEQVADILNIPLGTVRSRVSHALSRIRKHARCNEG